MIPFSILDLAPVNQGDTLTTAFDHSRQLAQAAETEGYTRIWLAEHHGMHSVASAATSVVLSHIGAHTKQIRIGAGGIMLPNHAPLVIAEQFGTLAALYPGRVDLGLGRAPGTDMATARALRRNIQNQHDSYPSDVAELQMYLGAPQARQSVIAIPGANSKVPLWLLGSSLYSAQMAAEFGLPFAFASHFAPAQLNDAIGIYRNAFKSSAQLEKPYAMAGIMVVIGDSDEHAEYLLSSAQQKFIHLHRGANTPFAPPIENIEEIWTHQEKLFVTSTLRLAAVGSADTVKTKLSAFIEHTELDELIVSIPVFDFGQKLKAVSALADMGYMKKS